MDTNINLYKFQGYEKRDQQRFISRETCKKSSIDTWR